MHVDLARELKARLSARLAPSLRASSAGDAQGWFPPALGLAPVGRDQAHLAIRVTAKEDADVLVSGLPDALARELDVRVIGGVHALGSPAPADLRRRSRPLHPGLSIGHPTVTAGTLGGFVRVGDRLGVLSNSHVLAASGAAALGDAILQPGPTDGGVPGDRVARLAGFERFAGSRRGNLVDAAVAVLEPGVPVDPARFPGGPLGTTVLDVAEVDPDEPVEKVGRTTGHTRGRITAVEVDGVAVQYGDGVHSFDGQIEIDGLAGGFSAGGDSGSVIWRSTDRAPLGLLFAGSDAGGRNGGGVTFANGLSTVLSVLGVEWVAG